MARQAKPLPNLTQHELDRFWRSVKKTDSCWLWTGSVKKTRSKGGNEYRYGTFWVERDGKPRQIGPHRISKALETGDRPDRHIDHLCPDTLCVNPAHLDWVTAEENRHRAAKRNTHCRRGHHVGHWGRDKYGNCRKCLKITTAARKAKSREIAA